MKINKSYKVELKLCKHAGLVVLEDLNVQGMLKNHCLAKSISDASFGEFRRQVEYKMKWKGGEVLLANRLFPSSQLCSRCGHKQYMELKDREYVCSKCGLIIGRDLNAARNLELLGIKHVVEKLRTTAVGPTVEARGGLRVINRPTKRELSSDYLLNKELIA